MPTAEFHNVLAWGDEEEALAGIQKKFVGYFPEGGKVLDLGCGRGIFLDLLKAEGREPVGVDMDETMVRHCGARGYKVAKNDAISFLRSTKDQFDGIFASHIIEHMTAAEGSEFIELMKARLNPKGVAIVVTPRPGSLWAAENFWLDTTHIRPFPYELMLQLFAPFKVVAGGIEPDSIPTKGIGRKGQIIHRIRRLLVGPDLYDFAYGGGVSYIVAQKNN